MPADMALIPLSQPLTVPAPETVGAAMVRFPKVCGPTTTVPEARCFFRDDHVHALLVVESGLLLTVLERADLHEGMAVGPVLGMGRLDGRVVDVGADLAATRQWMAERRLRRLAVVGHRGELLGLLCLKRSGRGFCTDDGVRARRLERGG